jgi:hypothetical protein
VGSRRATRGRDRREEGELGGFLPPDREEETRRVGFRCHGIDRSSGLSSAAQRAEQVNCSFAPQYVGFNVM